MYYVTRHLNSENQQSEKQLNKLWGHARIKRTIKETNPGAVWDSAKGALETRGDQRRNRKRSGKLQAAYLRLVKRGAISRVIGKQPTNKDRYL